jgi:phosphopantothenoylcysteine decarboxylase
VTSYRTASDRARDDAAACNGADTKVLYLVVCAVPGADRTLDRIRDEQAAGWDVCVIATERSLHWFDNNEVERLTGHPIQSRMRRFGTPLFQPLGDAVVVAPASFNTINRIAAGFADDMASGLVCEALGRDVPITIEPQVGDAFARHPAFAANVSLLESAGVTFAWHER